MLPTAQTSLLARTETPPRETRLFGGCGAGTIVQAVPFQCSVNGLAARAPLAEPPTAQISLAVSTLTALRKLVGEVVFGLLTIFHPQVCPVTEEWTTRKKIGKKSERSEEAAPRHRLNEY